MIIAQDVLRWLTVKALRGRTWAGMRVFDSPAQPADLRIEEDRASFIGVYTDDADLTFDGQSLNDTNATVLLTIECAVADQTPIVATSGDQDTSDADIDRPPATSSAVTLAQTDAGLEATIGFLSLQATQALLDGQNPWAELWRLMTTPGREGAETRRGGPGQQATPQPAVRYASRIMRFKLRVVGDPIWGEPINAKGFWYKFLAAAEADEELRDLAAIVRAHIERPGVSIPSWEIEQAIGTWTQGAVVGIGISPFLTEPDHEEAVVGVEGTEHDKDTGEDESVLVSSEEEEPPYVGPERRTIPGTNTPDRGGTEE